jgi:hypothetical protein
MANSQLFDNGLTDTLFKDGGFRPTFGVAASGHYTLSGTVSGTPGSFTIGVNTITVLFSGVVISPCITVTGTSLGETDMGICLKEYYNQESPSVAGVTFHYSSYVREVTCTSSGANIYPEADIVGTDGNSIVTEQAPFNQMGTWETATLTGGIDGAK